MNKDVYDDRFGRYYQLPLRLSQLGARLHMLLLAYQGEPSLVDKSDPNITWESIGLTGATRYFLRAKKLMEEDRVDLVVDSSDIPYCITAVWLGRRFGVPSLCNVN